MAAQIAAQNVAQHQQPPPPSVHPNVQSPAAPHLQIPIKPDPAAGWLFGNLNTPDPASSPGTPAISYYRFKEFKISGTIKKRGESDGLSLSSLKFQMQSGRDAGVPEREIQAAVIKAIKPGCNLRTFLESKGSFCQRLLSRKFSKHILAKRIQPLLSVI